MIVGKRHIDVLVSALLEHAKVPADADSLGFALWEANRITENYRNDLEYKPQLYEHAWLHVDPPTLCKLIDCYRANTDADDWLITVLATVGRRLKVTPAEYEAARWTIG